MPERAREFSRGYTINRYMVALSRGGNEPSLSCARIKHSTFTVLSAISALHNLDQCGLPPKILSCPAGVNMSDRRCVRCVCGPRVNICPTAPPSPPASAAKTTQWQHPVLFSPCVHIIQYSSVTHACVRLSTRARAHSVRRALVITYVAICTL